MKEYFSTLHGNPGMTWVEIGNAMGITNEGARVIFKKGIWNFTKHWLKVMGYNTSDKRVSILVSDDNWIKTIGDILRGQGDDCECENDVVNIDEEDVG